MNQAITSSAVISMFNIVSCWLASYLRNSDLIIISRELMSETVAFEAERVYVVFEPGV
jgi:hypothetical protein